MPRVEIHKDIVRYEEKIYSGLTKRMVVWFGVGIGVGALVALFCRVGLHVALEDAITYGMVAVVPFAVMGVWTPGSGLSARDQIQVEFDFKARRQKLLLASTSRASELAAARRGGRARELAAWTDGDGVETRR